VPRTYDVLKGVESKELQEVYFSNTQMQRYFDEIFCESKFDVQQR
jgi:hypothetical protein